jgi:CheY-like chemotaxis protein
VKLLFSVRDSGLGIPPEKHGEIFESYLQAPTARQYGGTGLGLAIAKELAEMMGGAIWLRSRPGLGSTFYFTATFQPPAVLAPRPTVEAAPVGDAHPLEVLVVDDNIVSQRLAVRLLEKQGHQAVCAGNGLQALDVLRIRRFDMVLTNIQMPEMDGLELLERIRSGAVPGLNPHIPVVAVTAHALKGDRERFLAAGMDGYIAKPVNATEFHRVLASTAAKHAACLPGKTPWRCTASSPACCPWPWASPTHRATSWKPTPRRQPFSACPRKPCANAMHPPIIGPCYGRTARPCLRMNIPP